MDTTFLMEQYNFNKPLTVKVIYDDDEQTVEEMINQNQSVQYDRRQSVEVQSIVPTYLPDQLNRRVESDMLNEAITYMSYIAETYHKFSEVFKDLSTAEAASFKLKYLDMKYRVFKNCFNVTKLLLLPQKSNESFIQNIVTGVLNKANLNGIMYKPIRLLYADLIAWTEDVLHKENNQVTTQMRQALNTTKRHHTVPHSNAKNKIDHRKRRFPPYDFGHLNASSEMLQNNSVENVASYFPMPNHSNNSIIEQNRTSYQLETQAPEQNIIYPAVVNTAPSNMIYYPPNYGTNSNAQKYFNESNNLSHIANMQGVNPAIVSQVRTTTIVSQNLSENNLSRQEINGADGRDISRSSISRDSGFMSPDNLISPREPMITHNQELTVPWQNTTATHDAVMPGIASNDRATGACQLCGRKSELLCLGCFLHFYCSKSCQNAHWPVHKLICPTNRRSFESNQ